MGAVPSRMGPLLWGTAASVLLVCPGWWETTECWQKPCRSTVGGEFPFSSFLSSFSILLPGEHQRGPQGDGFLGWKMHVRWW